MAKAKKQEKTIEQRLEEALVLYEKTPYELPSNWCWTTIKSVANVVTGGTPSKKHPEYYGNDFPFFKPADLEAGRNVNRASEYLSEKGKHVSRIIPAQSTAVCCIGSIGKSGYLEVEGTTNQQINSAIPKIDPLYLYYYINTNLFKNELWEKSSATTIAIVNKSKMEECYFPLAPLEEQKRIVEIIEKQFAKLDEARDLIQKSLDSFADRKSAILHKAFTGELTEKWRFTKNCGNWHKTILSKVAQWGSGGTPSRKNLEYYTGNIPWIKTGELNNSYLFDTEEKITQQAINNSSAKLYPIGTVIVAMYGATIGQCAILGIEATTNQACACAVVNEKIINNRFLFYYLLSQKSDFIALGKGGAQPNISQTVIKGYPINVPSLDEQEEIVRILDSIFEKEDKSKELIDMLDKIDEMKKSILARAFRGQLGTYNPTDEPAIDLLRKILKNQENIIIEKKENKSTSKKVLPFNRNLNSRLKKICELLLDNDGLSIDELAQGVGKDVRYLFDDIRELLEKQLIKLVDNRYWLNANN